MKIGYYLGSASLDGGGTAPYGWRLLELLLNNSKNYDIEIVILCTEEVQKGSLELITKYQAQGTTAIIKSYNFNYVERISRIAGIALAKILDKLNIDQKFAFYLNPLYRWFASLDIDLLHVPYQTAPIYDFYALPYPFIITMHDVQELHFPEFFTPEERAFRAEHYWKSLKYASGVVVSFNHVKQDLIKYFHLPESKIYVCPPPYTQIKLVSSTKEETEVYSKKYSNFQDFILYPAQTWEHKNHLSLIKSVELIKAKYNRSITVIFTGKKNDRFFPKIEKFLIKSTVSQQVIFTDIVPETELHWLYKNCALVVVPTLYEAGSFPLLEAIALGVPVICSSVTSLPETIGDSRFIFNPLDLEAMANSILQMIDGEELRNDNILNSKKRIQELREINSAPAFINAYRQVLRN
ncbi:glycosyltransferase family 4 protein [Laspinema olomoucense]|uniref:Glycosyltransferase family 4 protein n=1 Tax=Laspinema olomoucense D3b TaxID=2953688 RepID=A0ABT2N3X9_9CYAN|nr:MULTISPECIES: glycosyltransferase family 1 protein [unclassified Laspinema]MCT7977392.1 glycosyltransferase family 4 protein [Laspinema sp. D3b]MCT7986811.1 glycosyltransferase family 4 protein [Laspinema sp. D3a]